MGCGASSQPSEDEPKAAKTPVKNIDTDVVETFKQGTPSPGLKGKTVDNEPMPQPSTFVATPTREFENDNVSVSSYGTPEIIPDDSYKRSPPPAAVLAPGYKMNNEARKIGGFDPEAFRAVNQPKQGFADLNNDPGSSMDQSGGWATNVDFRETDINSRNQNPSQYGGNGNNMGYSNAGSNDRWNGNNSHNYIQSDDIFSSQSPQAMNSSARVDFHDDPLNDPFRAPGGMGHVQTDASRSKVITNEDDALMDDILGELDDV